MKSGDLFGLAVVAIIGVAFAEVACALHTLEAIYARPLEWVAWAATVMDGVFWLCCLWAAIGVEGK